MVIVVDHKDEKLYTPDIGDGYQIPKTTIFQRSYIPAPNHDIQYLISILNFKGATAR